MGLINWALVGGVMWVMKKAAEETEQKVTETARRYRNAELKANEQKRQNIVEAIRARTPCRFADGITQREFIDLAQKIGKQIKRVEDISIYGAQIVGKVQSQTGLSQWTFTIDYNDWGHLTGTRWTWSENKDSSIPDVFGKLLSREIRNLRKERYIIIKELSDVVDGNLELGTEEGFHYIKREKGIKNFFKKKKQLLSSYNSKELEGEHLFPVISLLKNNGYCNITSIPVKDIAYGSSNYIYEVQKVLLDNKLLKKSITSFENVNICIYYHDKKEIVFPFGMHYYKNKSPEEVKREFHKLGFSSVVTSGMKNLKIGLLKKENTVANISVGEDSTFSRGKTYLYDEQVVIFYNSY